MPPSQRERREDFEQLVTDILFGLGDGLVLRDGPDVDDAREAVMHELLARVELFGQRTTAQAAAVLEDVAHERQRQDEKWGAVSRPPLEWLGIAAEEFGEVAEKVVKGWVPPENDFDAEGYRTELVQLAAVCVSAVECLDHGTAGLGRVYPEVSDAA